MVTECCLLVFCARSAHFKVCRACELFGTTREQLQKKAPHLDWFARALRERPHPQPPPRTNTHAHQVHKVERTNTWKKTLYTGVRERDGKFQVKVGGQYCGVRSSLALALELASESRPDKPTIMLPTAACPAIARVSSAADTPLVAASPPAGTTPTISAEATQVKPHHKKRRHTWHAAAFVGHIWAVT